MSIQTICLTTAICIVVTSHSIAAQGWDDGATSSFSEEAIETVAPPSTPPAEQDASYIIKPGDTLWDLAFQFLKDPFQWEEIWEINKYIADPNLIYPNNQLLMPWNHTSAPRSEEPISWDDQSSINTETTVAINQPSTMISGNDAVTPDGYPGDDQVLTSLRLKDVLSKRYLSTVPFLWTEKNRLGNIFPGNGVVIPPKIGRSYYPFSTLSFKLLPDASYKTGDTVDIFSSLRFVRFNNKPANLVKRVGRACIKKSGKKEASALLFEMANPIIGKEMVAPSTVFSSRIIDTLVPPSTPIAAAVFTRVEETESPYPFQMIILNKGSTEGIELGDVFGVYHRDQKDAPLRLSMIGTIAHVGNGSSTMNIISMAQNRIAEGDSAMLLRRAQYSQ